MTNYNERLDKALERLAVAGRGWGVSESVQIESMSSELAEAKQAITSLIKELVDEVIGEDESSGIFPGIGESSTMRDDLRAEQRDAIQKIRSRYE